MSKRKNFSFQTVQRRSSIWVREEERKGEAGGEMRNGLEILFINQPYQEKLS